ncbi:hypothetical protein D3C81_09930 [compost metagenome]
MWVSKRVKFMSLLFISVSFMVIVLLIVIKNNNTVEEDTIDESIIVSSSDKTLGVKVNNKQEGIQQELTDKYNREYMHNKYSTVGNIEDLSLSLVKGELSVETYLSTIRGITWNKDDTIYSIQDVQYVVSTIEGIETLDDIDRNVRMIPNLDFAYTLVYNDKEISKYKVLKVSVSIHEEGSNKGVEQEQQTSIEVTPDSTKEEPKVENKKSSGFNHELTSKFNTTYDTKYTYNGSASGDFDSMLLSVTNQTITVDQVKAFITGVSEYSNMSDGKERVIGNYSIDFVEIVTEDIELLKKGLKPLSLTKDLPYYLNYGIYYNPERGTNTIYRLYVEMKLKD